MADNLKTGWVSDHSKKVAWYSDNIDRLGDSSRKLLEKYSRIPASQTKDHIYKIRDEGWEVAPYPCIGQFRFLDLAISLSPHYPTILSRLKTGNENLIDLGCCFGQDLRKLVADGAPSENLYGMDLEASFFDLGYKLFRDEDTLKSTFISGDIFATPNPLEGLKGKMDMVFMASFIHLFSYEQQVEVCKMVVGLLRDRKGSMLFGRQIGSVKAGATVDESGKESKFRHNEETFRRMWKEVEVATGTKWRVEFEMLPDDEDNAEARKAWNVPDMKRLRFAVFKE